MSLKIEVEKHPDYRTILVSGMYGGHRPGFLEAIVYTDELNADQALSTPQPDSQKVSGKRTLQCRLYFDPVTAKSIAEWFAGHVADYEKLFGKIPSPGEVAKAPMGTPTYG